MPENNASAKTAVNPATDTPKAYATPTVYNANKYQSNSVSYPSDLFSNANVYGDNYVVFYINVPSESKLIKENRVTVTNKDTVSVGSALAAAGITETQANLAYDFANAGLAALLGITGTGGGKAAVGALGAGALLATSQSMRQSKRITDTIALNIPQSLVARYTMNYQEADLAAMTAIAHVGKDVSKFLEDASSGGNMMQTLKNSEIGNAIAGAALATPGTGDFLSAATGLAANPKKEQIFKNVDFRIFNFQYLFAPRSENEAKNVQQIIKTFKLHMHPEYKDANAYLFLMPSEFDIVYYQGMTENLNLPRHTSCVLVDMSVNYTPNNQFNSFKDGGATQIEVNLTFKELAILTKDEIMDGF